jgi:hypothetical protein
MMQRSAAKLYSRSPIADIDFDDMLNAIYETYHVIKNVMMDLSRNLSNALQNMQF